jgi:hypothetical protein
VADMRLATATMSMYSELLAMSLTQGDEILDGAASNEKRLLQELVDCRERLRTDQAIAPSRRPDAPSRIATELQYDRALINLCRLHAIPCDVGRFTRPQQERKRLEEALETVGLDVRTARRHDSRRTVAGGDHEPPVGS